MEIKTNGTYDGIKHTLTFSLPLDNLLDYSNATITLPSDLHSKIMNYKSIETAPRLQCSFATKEINDLITTTTIKKATIMKVTKHPKFYSLKVRCPECNKISNNGTNRTKFQRQCNYCFNEYNIDMGSAFPDL